MSFVIIGLALAILINPAISSSSSCKTISAAFSFGDESFFVVGDQVYVIGTGNILHDIMSIHALGFPHELTAAVDIYEWGEFYLVGGDEDVGYSDIGYLNYDSLFAGFDIAQAFGGKANFHGIDAAVEVDDSEGNSQIMYFSGCNHVTVSLHDLSTPSQMKANSEIGLPCDVDAALYSSNAGDAIVIKHDAFWMHNSDTQMFDGPGQLTSMELALDIVDICPLH